MLNDRFIDELEWDYEAADQADADSVASLLRLGADPNHLPRRLNTPNCDRLGDRKLLRVRASGMARSWALASA